MAEKITFLGHEYNLVQCNDEDIHDVFISPIPKWLDRVPEWSYTRYYDKAVFKSGDDKVYAAYWNNLDNWWEI